jgi:regulator of sirC expression with transglutaminase-like and TPR domain
MRSFEELAATEDPPLDELALAVAAAFRDVDADAALDRLDQLGAALTARLDAGARAPWVEARALAALLGGEEGFGGDRQEYDRPENSLLDVVLERRRGLPILLSIVYVEVARRAGVRVLGVGLPGHFVVGHFGTAPPLLLDPFDGGAALEAPGPAELLRPWPAKEVAMRMLNNLVASLERRGDLAGAMRAAAMREALPADTALRETLQRELRGLHARLN